MLSKHASVGCVSGDCDSYFLFSVHFYPTCVLILKSLSTVGHSTVHVHDVVTDWSYALVVSSLFRAFLFLAILATFTLQMFFSFDSLSFFITVVH